MEQELPPEHCAVILSVFAEQQELLAVAKAVRGRASEI
jgi:hypothetical protein